MNSKLNGFKNVYSTSFLCLLQGGALFMIFHDLGGRKTVFYFSCCYLYLIVIVLHIYTQNHDVIQNIKYIKAYQNIICLNILSDAL